MAVERLPWLRRVVLQRRLRNKAYREAVEQELACRCADDDECCRLVPAFAAMSSQENYSTAQEFAIDLDNLEKFLQIIIKYLPQIIELIFKFFPVVAFALVSFLGQAAVAQCENGVCRMPIRQAVGRVVQAAETIATAAVVAPARVPAAIIEPQRSMGAHLAQMNASNTMFHSSAPTENVYYSSNGATRFEARRAWRASPAHAANLKKIVPLFGIKCRGNYCVARGR